MKDGIDCSFIRVLLEKGFMQIEKIIQIDDSMFSKILHDTKGFDPYVFQMQQNSDLLTVLLAETALIMQIHLKRPRLVLITALNQPINRLELHLMSRTLEGCMQDESVSLVQIKAWVSPMLAQLMPSKH